MKERKQHELVGDEKEEKGMNKKKKIEERKYFIPFKNKAKIYSCLSQGINMIDSNSNF